MRSDTGGLPDSYKNRKFIANDGGMEYDAASIPGNIVKYNAESQTYEIVTIKAIIKANKAPVAQGAAGAVVYQGQVTSTSSFNGSYLINGLTAEKNQVIDIVIKDDPAFTVPDGQVDTAGARASAKSIAPADLKDYYYVLSATRSLISYNIHAAETAISKANKKMDKLSKADTAKKGFYLKSTSKSSDQYSSSQNKGITEKVVSVQVIPLGDLVSVTGKK
jgi:hypothetical protein